MSSLQLSSPSWRFYSAALLVTLALAAAVGHRLLRKVEVAVPLVEHCRLDQQACTAELPGGGQVEVAIDPRAISGVRPFTLSVAPRGIEVDKVEAEFTGVVMNMGGFRYGLTPGADGRYSGQMSLPLCVSNTMLWQATVVIHSGRKAISVPFHFEDRHD